MKILFLNYEYPPLGGGASTATEAILKEWAKTPDMEVHLVTAAVGNEYERIHLGGEVYVHRVPIGKDQKKLHSQSMRDIVIYSWKAFWFARTLIREEQQKSRFDATLAFFTIPCGFIAYLLKRCSGIPYAVSLRGADVPGFSEKYDTFYLFLKPLVRFLWHRAIAVIPNSVGIRALAEKTDAKQMMKIIENGVDTEVFCPAEKTNETASVIFLSTSRLTPRKGIDKLIAAFATATGKSSVPMELHLIGEGEQHEMLEKQAAALGVADRVHFLGRVEHDGLAPFYQESHVFVLPSKNEGMSNSALEALASGLPLVVSGTGGMQELVSDGENGYFIDPDDTDGFANVLIRCAEHKERSADFGMESRRRAERRGWNKVAENFRETLTKAL